MNPCPLSYMAFLKSHHYSTNSMTYQLGNVPTDPEEYSAEQNTILTIANNKGFPSNLVTKIINRFKKKKLMKLLYSPGSISSVSIKVGKQLSKYGIRPSTIPRALLDIYRSTKIR
jgi:hypothetical protein